MSKDCNPTKRGGKALQTMEERAACETVWTKDRFQGPQEPAAADVGEEGSAQSG